jgi:hypothetical protein
VIVAAQATELRQAPKRSPRAGIHAHPHAIGTAAGTVEGIAWNRVAVIGVSPARYTGRHVVVAEHDPVLVLTNYGDDCSYGPVGQKGNHSPWVGISCAEMGSAGPLSAFDRPVRFEGEGEVMKRSRMLTLLGMLAVVLPIGFAQGVAKADTGPQVIIQPDASYNLAGAVINVGLDVKCQGGSGDVVVNVTQSPPQTPYPVGAGSGPQLVVCDGQMHTVAVTVTGFGFDAGTAWATADLTTGSPAVVAHAQRSITIVVD